MNNRWRRAVATASIAWATCFATAWAHVESAKSVGFDAADGDGVVSEAEMTAYLQERLNDSSLPYPQIFAELDTDEDGNVSRAEFAARHGVLEQYLEEPEPSVPEDPGAGYVPYTGLDQPLDDRGIYGAIYGPFGKKCPTA